jgi:hypothetical protein
MLTLKSQLTCSYCSKIFKDPIELPCVHSICREHLSERTVVRENIIKCKECQGEFQVKENEFKSNSELVNSIESQSHLSGEEISLKKELEESFQKFFQFYDEFIQNRTKLDLDVFNHFQEIRFQIDEHRERLKERIDDIALAMIDETKKSEATFLKELNDSFSSFDDCKPLEHELNQIEETFRHPNLLFESIKEMQQKQKESLNDIQIKLNKTNQLKVLLKLLNTFIPNLSSLNQKEETSLFGTIRLNAYWLNRNPLKSEILTNNQQSFELIYLCKFSPNDKWSLLYRGTRDGFGAKDFHSKCDSQSNTLTILKAKQTSYIFGGYTTVAWKSSTNGKFTSDPNAFIFSLTNKDNKPLKMKVDPNQHEWAFCCHSEYGPIFGGGHDIYIDDNANKAMKNYSNLGHTYKHPQYEYKTNEAETFLAGKFQFRLDEIEVYQKE